jgi:hypothetical protein
MKKLHVLLTGLALAAVVAVGYSATKPTPQSAKAPDGCAAGSCCDGCSCCR